MPAYYQDYEYINKKYGVPAERGRRIRAYGKSGQIVSARGHYIGVRLDGENETGQYHPVDGIEYLDEKGNVIFPGFEEIKRDE